MAVTRPSDIPPRRWARVEQTIAECELEHNEEGGDSVNGAVYTVLRIYTVFIHEVTAAVIDSPEEWTAERFRLTSKIFLDRLVEDVYEERAHEIDGVARRRFSSVPGEVSYVLSGTRASFKASVLRELTGFKFWTEFQENIARLSRRDGAEQTPDQMVVASRLKSLRLACQWSHQELAHQAKLHKTTVIAHEKGKHPLRPSTVKQYAAAFSQGLGRTVTSDEIDGPLSS
jgi:DNA-binding XRE family transcriptional regulator